MSEITKLGQRGDTENSYRRGVKIFGVYLTETSSEEAKRVTDEGINADSVSHEDMQIGSSGNREPRQSKKKGRSWTEEEHRRFLRGLEELGKGHWKGIATRYVRTRTSTQVASHAQKHFIRQEKANKDNLRQSIFDTPFSRETVNSRAAEIAMLSGGTPILPLPQAGASTSSSISIVTTNNGINSSALPLWPRLMDTAQIHWGYPQMFAFWTPTVAAKVQYDERHR